MKRTDQEFKGHQVKKIFSFINRSWNVPIPKWIPWTMLIIAGALYLMIALLNHYFFRTYAWDYGAYNFAFYDYAHFRVSDSPVYFHEHMSFLQDHLSFTMFIFIPFYWLLAWLTGTYTLLILQTIIIIYGAWAVIKLILLKTENTLYAILAVFMYLFLAGRWTAFFSDCNFAIMASSLVPVMMYYFERKKWTPLTLVYVFILLTREDMALWTAFIGLFYVVQYYRIKIMRRTAVLITLTSICYFILAFKVLIPAIETPEKPFVLFNYSALGKGPIQASLFIIRHPVEAVRLLFVNFSGDPAFDGVKTEFYTYYLLCGGFLLFFRPKYLLLFIPIVAKKMYNDDPIRWSMELYYSIEFVSLLPVVVFLILSELKKSSIKNLSLAIISIIVIVLTVVELDNSNRKLNWWGDSKYAFYKKDFYKSSIDVRKVYNYLDRIPKNAKVSASTGLLPHLAFREKIYYFTRVEDAEYIVILNDGNTYPFTKEEFDNILNLYKTSDLWIDLIDDHSILVMKKH